MEARHEMTARVRKLRPVFYQIGLLTGLLIILGAFKWTTHGETVSMDTIFERGLIDTAIGEIRIEEEQKPDEQQTKKTKLEIPNPDPQKVVENTLDNPDTNVVEQFDPAALFSFLANKPEMKRGPEEFPNEEPVWVPSQLPEFPGGDEARVKYFQKNYLVPADILENPAMSSISMLVKCVIEKDGSVSNVKVVKDGGYPAAAEAFVKTTERMPRWVPGYQGAHPVRVYVTIPMKIRLR